MDVTRTIDTSNAEATNREVRRILGVLLGHKLMAKVEVTLEDIVRLFGGQYPGYQRCDTAYHDLEHSLQAYLAAARIFGGMVQDGSDRTSPNFIALGLISALGHDTGFIKAMGDYSGHGSKYTLTHVERSKEFMSCYLLKLGVEAGQVCSVMNMISCTGLNVDVKSISFTSAMERTAGCVVGSADYLGQMSDPLYTEKLPRLYDEYQEGSVPGYGNADDLVRMTPAFFEEFVMKRLNNDYEGVYRFAGSHFRGRDIYIEGIRKNIAHVTRKRLSPSDT